jgi:hypothetical protein
MTTHTYTMPGPLSPAPVHADFEGGLVVVPIRGTTWRRDEPVGYIYLAEATTLIGPMPEHAVSSHTVAELDELDRLVEEDRVAEVAYQAQLAEAKRLGYV